MTASAIRLSAIFVMVLAGSTGAQRDAPRPSDGSAVIRGRVVAGDTLAPLREVTLSLHHADKVPTIRTGVQVVDQSTFVPGLTVRTDANGQFELVGYHPDGIVSGLPLVRRRPGIWRSAIRIRPRKNPNRSPSPPVKCWSGLSSRFQGPP